MRAAAFIVGDWGTSHLRLALCDAGGAALERREAPGAAASRGRFPEVFDAATEAWRREHGELPVMLAGMVGASFGWQEVPYLVCPVALDDLGGHVTAVRGSVCIVPGLKCVNPLGAPDVMRGEETQLLGARRLDAALGRGSWLFCLPGTHTKWVQLDDGLVQAFITVPTGELFALLCRHSVLVSDGGGPVEHRADEFARGMAEARRQPQAPLHRLFQARSRRMAGELAPEGAAAWTSGLLIASDVDGALPLFDVPDTRPVCVVGNAQLAGHYVQALRERGRATLLVDGEAAAIAGLAQCFRQREPRP